MVSNKNFTTRVGQCDHNLLTFIRSSWIPSLCPSLCTPSNTFYQAGNEETLKQNCKLVNLEDKLMFVVCCGYIPDSKYSYPAPSYLTASPTGNFSLAVSWRWEEWSGQDCSHSGAVCHSPGQVCQARSGHWSQMVWLAGQPLSEAVNWSDVAGSLEWAWTGVGGCQGPLVSPWSFFWLAGKLCRQLFPY